MEGVEFKVDPASVVEVGDYIEGVRARLLAGIREGMQEGMEALANVAGNNLQAITSGQRQGPGRVLSALLQSPRVWQNQKAIGGYISAYVPGKGDVGGWLERGTSVPAVQGAKGMMYGFYAADGQSVFTHGHKAFTVAPHPFMQPALDEMTSTLIEIIQSKVANAVAV